MIFFSMFFYTVERKPDYGKRDRHPDYGKGIIIKKKYSFLLIENIKKSASSTDFIYATVDQNESFRTKFEK